MELITSMLLMCLLSFVVTISFAWQPNTGRIRGINLISRLLSTTTNSLDTADHVKVSYSPSSSASPVTGGGAVSTNYVDIPDEEKLGQIENQLYDCDGAVSFWATFEANDNQKNLAMLLETIQPYLLNGDAQARAYWTSHLLRTGYFATNAALGSIASDLHERFMAGRSSDSQNNGAQSSISSPPTSMALNILNSTLPTRLLVDAMKVYEQDYAAVKNGYVKYPWDAAIRPTEESKEQKQQLFPSFDFFSHRQFNPFFVAEATQRVVRESISIFSRRNKARATNFAKPTKLWMTTDDRKQKQREEDTIRSGVDQMYPDYYMNDFHFQTDGWLSSESAATYEASTETLFLGRQDAMQRQTIIPIKKYFGSTFPQSILEVGAGTGRFATFVRDNFATSDMTISDLSPFYLEKARENDKYWRESRGMAAVREAIGVANYPPTPAKFVQANAEQLPFEDNSFDVVMSVYMFHELPEEARRNVAQEMARVCKPGGLVVVTDSVQLGDRLPYDPSIGNFSNLNEPHYQNYISVPISDLFVTNVVNGDGDDSADDVLVQPSEKYVVSSTKTVSFIKPLSLPKA